MQKEYATVLQQGIGEITEKKSRFIGYVSHAETEEEAMEFVASIRKKHYDARHNCYAYIVGEEQSVVRFSDDGEPGGTAGKPILEVLQGGQLCNVCLVVTRYFGGTLLGTGGLVRAYTQAAKECIAATEVVVKRKVIPVWLQADYTDAGKLQYYLQQAKLPVLETQYAADVRIHIEVPFELVEQVQEEVTQATAGRVQLTREEAVFSMCRRE